MTVTDVRPLAGVGFEDVPPVPPRVLPRMDVVGFVGYASSGPVHTPVPVESVEDYRRVFGNDVQLGWDVARRRPVTSQLGAAVRDFFVNGGTRAWVVRAAGEDISRAHAPLPGVLAVGAAPGTPASVSPASLVAASPGAAGGWAELACAAVGDPVEVVGPGPRATWLVRSRGGLVVGDLVRTVLSEHVLHVRVDQVSAPGRRTRTARTPLGGLPVVDQHVRLSAPLVAVRRTAPLLRHDGPARVVDVEGAWQDVRARVTASHPAGTWTHAAATTLELSAVGASPRPALGGWVRLPGWADHHGVPTEAWVAVDEVVPGSSEGHCVVRGRVCVPVPPPADRPRTRPGRSG